MFLLSVSLLLFLCSSESDVSDLSLCESALKISYSIPFSFPSPYVLIWFGIISQILLPVVRDMSSSASAADLPLVR